MSIVVRDIGGGEGPSKTPLLPDISWKFTGKDEGLPLLTQFYQVPPADPQKDYEYTPMPPLTPPLMEWWNDQQTRVEQKEGLWVTPRTRDSVLPRLILWHEYARQIMDSIADTDEVAGPMLSWINEQLKQYFQPRIMLHGCSASRGLREPYPEDPLISTHSVHLFFTNPDELSRTEENLLLELARIITNPGSVERCTECNSAYVVRNEHQRFCSFRCFNRWHVRNYRARKKAVRAQESV